MTVQAGNKNANARNDSSNWGEAQQQSVNLLFERFSITEGNWEQSQLVPVKTPSACGCSQELEHFHIHQGSTNIRAEDPGNTSYYHDER